MRFKAGDVVRFKSGGHKMTIARVFNKMVAVWWSDGIEVYRKQIPRKTLVKVTKKAKVAA